MLSKLLTMPISKLKQLFQEFRLHTTLKRSRESEPSIFRSATFDVEDAMDKLKAMKVL
jgi:hypothetical protein